MGARTSPDVVSRKLGDTTVVVNLRTNRIYELNRTASRFWTLLESGLDRDEAERVMLSEYDVDDAQLRAEADRLLVWLEREGVRHGDRPD